MDDTFDFFIRVIYRMEHGPQIEAYRRWLAELEKAKYIFLNTPYR